LGEELPAIPLYSNNLNYLLKDSLQKTSKEMIPTKVAEKNERFININKWYVYKESVWKFSYKKILIEKLQNIIH
ncbi:MAG: hypothetical protein RI945_52, partial [Candidatus Parcubacteria bacterium]